MAESIIELQNRLDTAVAPGFRERLLDKGLARGLIWQDGVLPQGSPPFSASLTQDLLDYANAVMVMALRLRTHANDSKHLERAFLVAGEAIEAAIHRGGGGRDHGFQRVSAAIAFHLARYAARSYSMVPADADADNLAPTEQVLVHLLRRKLDKMHSLFSSWLLDVQHEDARIAAMLRDDQNFNEVDATHIVLTSSFMRGLALFDHAITTGSPDSATQARHQLVKTSEAARELNMVSHWWTATLASHLVDELWLLSLFEQVPELPPDDDDHGRWKELRRNYIQRLRAGERSAIELWPSQLEAVSRAVDLTDDLVVALPTSAGKTRIAELCILRTLAAERRVVYITPLRALSSQIERDLAGIFTPLGFSVSSLYGSAGIEFGDTKTLRDGKVVVATPEKLDFALRNDPTIIDDVGLLVLDEGHMLGPNEREVRYEALVQRILKRNDASSRRIVCLSALFPTPEEMKELVAWIRQDNPGGPVHSTWRPTRQRFGIIRWMSDAARLDVKVEEESPFVPRFIETQNPPTGSRRKKKFPGNKNELTLAVAWRFVGQGKEVLIYCPIRKSVGTLGKLIQKCIEHGVLAPLRTLSTQIREAMKTGSEWLGSDHPAVQCLQYGVALHHGGLPRPFLNEVEKLLRLGECPLTIASPTLAQGLNLSASILLVPSIWRNREIIPATEFANVSGRAGRAFVDVEGLVLHIIWEDSPQEAKRTLQNWEKLVTEAKAPRVISGILRLAAIIFKRIAKVAGIPSDEVIEYVTGHSDSWCFSQSATVPTEFTKEVWERDIASLDAAILALLDAETDDISLEPALDRVMEGSLFARQIVLVEERVQKLLRGFVTARAKKIWSDTLATQRKGYHTAGVGLQAGQFLDVHLVTLVDLLVRAESAVLDRDATVMVEVTVEFAELVFQTAPFRPPNELPDRWRDALRAWLEGQPSAQVLSICDDDGIDLLQDALVYRLPWAMEAVRVHAIATGQEGANKLHGLAALAVESGSVSLSAITLLRSGLNSRAAAITAAETTGASFTDRDGMLTWLSSEKVKVRNADKGWPTKQTRHAWVQFYSDEAKGPRQKWKRETMPMDASWFEAEPSPGSLVVLEPHPSSADLLILSPDFRPIGVATYPSQRANRNIVNAWVGEEPKTVWGEFYSSSSPATEVS